MIVAGEPDASSRRDGIYAIDSPKLRFGSAGSFAAEWVAWGGRNRLRDASHCHGCSPAARAINGRGADSAGFGKGTARAAEPSLLADGQRSAEHGFKLC